MNPPQGPEPDPETASPGPGRPEDPPGRFSRLAPWVLLAFAVLVVLSVRIRLLGMPLERDEGEYAAGGQLLLRGLPMYSHLYTMKLPGTHAAFALSMALFGETPAGIRLGFLFANLAAIALVCLLGLRVADARTGALAAAAYALLSLSPSVLGLAAHATHFVVVPALLGFLALEHAIGRRRPWEIAAAGVLLGLAPLMKQSGAFLILFAGLRLAAAEFRRTPRETSASLRRLAALALGVALPYAITCRLVWRAGDFERFWFWTMQYGRAYVGEVTAGEALSHFARGAGTVTGPAAGIWLLALAGLALAIRKPGARPSGPWLAALLACSAVAVCPGFWFRPHYFVVALPAIALLAGAGVRSLLALAASRPAPVRALPWVVAAAAFAQPLVAHARILFTLPPAVATRAMYPGRSYPFPEAEKIGRFLRDASAPADRVAVLTSEPEICFYADRRSATGYIYMYPLNEDHPWALDMRIEMQEEIARAAPAWAVLLVPDSPVGPELHIAGRRFERVCVLEVTGDVSAPLITGEAARAWEGGGAEALVVYRRTP